jgi:hypothetical protein
VDCWEGAFYAGMRATEVISQDGCGTITKAEAERHEQARLRREQETKSPRRSPKRPKACLTSQEVQERLDSGQPIHRKEIPDPPFRHADLDEHPFGKLFKAAEESHLQEHAKMGSWIEILAKDPRARGHKVLDCKWVYVYKFNKHGFFVKTKSRLVVRGDQQLRGAHENTYAATLAGRSFRALMAIAARFDLDLLQYDAVNAFVHANIDQDIFMRMPPGYRRAGWIVKLQKALYGLRRSPLLWQRELSESLKKIGFKQVPH